MFFATCLITCNHVLALNATSLLAVTCLCKNQAGGHFGILTGINVEFFPAITKHRETNSGKPHVKIWLAFSQRNDNLCIV